MPKTSKTNKTQVRAKQNPDDILCFKWYNNRGLQQHRIVTLSEYSYFAGYHMP